MSTVAAPQGIFNDTLIKRFVDDPLFIRRPWLEINIKKNLFIENKQLLLLEGEPGSGKTAFMASLANASLEWQQSWIWLNYFIRGDRVSPFSNGDAHSFLISVGHQLAALYPNLFPKKEISIKQNIEMISPTGTVLGAKIGELLISPFYNTAQITIEQNINYAKGKLTGVEIEKMVAEARLMDIGNLTHLALVEPATKLLKISPNKKIVILIDALDELRYNPSDKNILYWLTYCPKLPANINLILSSRSDPDLLGNFKSRRESQITLLTINERSGSVHSDIRNLASKFIGQETISQKISEYLDNLDEFLNQLVAKADGNFQFLIAYFSNLSHLLDQGSKENIQAALNLQDLPDDLEKLYAMFIKQIKDTIGKTQVEILEENTLTAKYGEAWEHLYQPILGILSVVKEPISYNQLKNFIQVPITDRWIITALENLNQFFDRETDLISLYHATFPEFLKSKETEKNYPGCYFAEEEWHKKIVNYYLRNFKSNWSECDDYGLTYLVHHVIDGKYYSVLNGIITKKFRKANQDQFGWLYEYMESLEKLAKVKPEIAAKACLDVMLEGYPNSLVIQRGLRLLIKIKPNIEKIGNPNFLQHQNIDKVIDILIQRESQLNNPELHKLEEQYFDELQKIFNASENPRIKSIVALAMGETGNQGISRDLLEIFKTKAGSTSWSAADALIALNDRKIIPDLVQFYFQTESPWYKEKIIYILGRMQAEEALEIKHNARTFNRVNILGRALDLTWLLPKEAEDEEYLLAKLQHVIDTENCSDYKKGAWRNEWVQKRLVRAIHKLDLEQALTNLELLQDLVSQRKEIPESQTKKSRERKELVKSLKKAIQYFKDK